MKKTMILLLTALVSTLLLTSCGGEEETAPVEEASGARPVVELTVWCSEEDMELLHEITAAFQTSSADQADLRITCEPQGEAGCKDALLADLENGPDVFTFADDQVAALAAAGALDPIADPSSIRAASLSAATEAASVDGTLYAYPLTADNGYFLYYNKAYFTEEEVERLDLLLNAAVRAGRQFSMDWTSAWYVYAFFGNTGLEIGLNEDGLTNFCNWNSTDGPITGEDVARSMLAVAASPGFVSRTDEEFLQGVRDGSIIAGVSGVWNAVAIQEVWGEDMGAAKLPTFPCKGEQVQMASFSGCKLIGVNAYSPHPEWAAQLAEWITSETNQRLRFERRGQGPANRTAASSPEVQESPAIAALLAQSEYSQLQRIGGNFWSPVAEFAANMAEGNPSGASLQAQLDHMVEKITAR